MTQIVFQFAVLIPTAIVFVTSFLLLTLKLVKRNYHVWVLRAIIILLLTFEVIKQAHLLGVNGHIPPYNLPFFFCSTFYITFLITSFGSGRVSKIVNPYSFYAGLFCGLSLNFVPFSIYNLLFQEGTIDIFLGLHSMFFHMLLVCFSLFMFFSKFYRPTFKDTISAIVITVFFGLVVLGLSRYVEYLYSRDGTRFIELNYFELGRNTSFLTPLYNAVTYPVGLLIYAMGLYGIFCFIFLVFRGPGFVYRKVVARKRVTTY